MSWDDLEKQAEEDDRRAAQRRQAKDIAPVPIKRGPPPRRR